MRKIGIILLAVCMTIGVLGCSNSDSSDKEITELHISAAASLQEAMVEVEKEFKVENPDVKLIVNLGSSGSLMQQIEQGAPCDVFISAGTKQMDELIKNDKIDKDTNKTLLTNDLVLIATKDENIDSLDDLENNRISKVAMGDPESVPAGKYAKEVLDNEKLYDKIQDKLVLAKDVKEVLSWVKNGNARVGFVYLSDAKDLDKIDVVLTADKDSHSPIDYPIGITKDSKQRETADKFEEFMLSDKGQSILEKYGFNRVK